LGWLGGGEESLAQSTGVMDIWKGRCRERACIVIDKLVGRKMERISKHFFAFILNYFSFFLWQVCDGVKDGEFPLRKASF
jgi:hypothetical protein